MTYLGQAALPFFLPCHCSPGYRGNATTPIDADVMDCAGAAIFRANIGVYGWSPFAPSWSPHLLRLPAQSDLTVFATAAEFYAYHVQCTPEEAKERTTMRRVGEAAARELRLAIELNRMTLTPKP